MGLVSSTQKIRGINNKNGLVLLYTDAVLIIDRIKAELELQGISSIVKNGFVGGVCSRVEILMAESEFDKSVEIIKAIVDSFVFEIKVIY